MLKVAVTNSAALYVVEQNRPTVHFLNRMPEVQERINAFNLGGIENGDIFDGHILAVIEAQAVRIARDRESPDSNALPSLGLNRRAGMRRVDQQRAIAVQRHAIRADDQSMRQIIDTGSQPRILGN